MRFIDVVSRSVRLAQRQAGVITFRQLVLAGITEGQMARMVESGVFQRRHRGVFVLAGTPESHALSIRAALAAVGPSAAASHRSAAWLHGLIDRPPTIAQLTAVRDHASKLRSVELHRCRSPFMVLRVQGLPCTSALRTLVDLAATAPEGLLEEAVDRAVAQQLIRPGDLDLSSAEVIGRAGAKRLRYSAAYEGLVGGPPPTVLESRFRRLMKHYGIALPEPQVHAGPDGRYRIDYAFADILLALEAYGFAWHHTPEQLDHDLKRQNQLTSGGWTVLPYTYRQIVEEPQRVAEEIAGTYHRLHGLHSLHRIDAQASQTA